MSGLSHQKIIRLQKAAHCARIAKRAKPQCGAKTKQGGVPCVNVAMANGRCSMHGGLTPKGDQWHVVQYRRGISMAKLERKLQKNQRDQEERQLRRVRMTPDERQDYDEWLSTHQPGSSAVRARRRQDREAGKWLASLGRCKSKKTLTPS